MKKRISLALFGFCCSLSAFSASLGTLQDPPRWAGFYAGVNAGALFAGRYIGSVQTAPFPSDGNTVTTQPYRLSMLSANSPTGGIQLGYNWQISQLGLGVEGDFNFTDLNKNQTLTLKQAPSYQQTIYGIGDTFSAKMNWQSSLRGRIGYATQKWLFYGTGGVAFANVKMGANFLATPVSPSLTYPGSSASSTKVMVGGTIGAGAEYALSHHWGLGLEYRFTAYGKQKFGVGSLAAVYLGGGQFTYAAETETIRLYTNSIMAKLNYRFG